VFLIIIIILISHSQGLLAYGCVVIQGTFSIPNSGQCLPHQFASKSSNVAIYDCYKPEFPSLFAMYALPSFFSLLFELCVVISSLSPSLSHSSLL
jgi:hypothetical protein